MVVWRKMAIAVAAVVLTAPGAWAQSLARGLGAWSVARGQGGVWASHAWAVLDDGVGEPVPYTLVHLPPRRRAGSADGVAHGAIDGAARAVVRLARAPEALVAHGPTVLLVYPPLPERPDQRMVMSVTAVSAGIADLWRYLPDGRLEALSVLPTGGRIMGAADSPVGPAVLVDDGVASAPEPCLWVLHRGAWKGVLLSPEAVRGVAGVWEGVLEGSRLVASGRGMGIVGGGPGGGLGVWIIGDEALRAAVAEEGPVRVAPTFEPQSRLAGALAPWAIALEVGGRLTIVDRAEAGALRLRQMTMDGGLRDLGRVADVPKHAAVVGLDSAGRIAAVWRDPPGEGRGRGINVMGPAGSLGVVRMVEVSGLTGRVMYRGPAVLETPMSAGQFRLLVMVVLGVMVGVLLMVLRQPQADAVVLPRGTALAEPGRRLLAGLIDAAAAMGVSLAIWGMSPGALFSLSEWLVGSAFQAVLTAAGVGLAMGTVLEGWMGRTPGKYLLGCEVVKVRSSGEGGEPEAPGLRAAFMRNLVKWVLPPVALLSLLDPGGLGRGSGVGSTRVVVRVGSGGEG